MHVLASSRLQNGDKHFSHNAQYNAKNYLGLPVLTNNDCKMLTKKG